MSFSFSEIIIAIALTTFLIISYQLIISSLVLIFNSLVWLVCFKFKQINRKKILFNAIPTSIIILGIISFICIFYFKITQQPLYDITSHNIYFYAIAFLFLINSMDSEDVAIIKIYKRTSWIYLGGIIILLYFKPYESSLENQYLINKIALTFAILFNLILLFFLSISIPHFSKSQESIKFELDRISRKLGYINDKINVINNCTLEKKYEKEIDQIKLEFETLYKEYDLAPFKRINNQQFKTLIIKLELIQFEINNFFENDLKNLILEKLAKSIGEIELLKKNINQDFIHEGLNITETLFKKWLIKIDEIDFNSYIDLEYIGELCQGFNDFENLKKGLSLIKNSRSQLNSYEGQINNMQLFVDMAIALNLDITEIEKKLTLIKHLLNEFKESYFSTNEEIATSYHTIALELITIREFIQQYSIELNKQYAFNNSNRNYTFVIPKYSKINTTVIGLIIFQLKNEIGSDTVNINSAGLKIEKNSEKLTIGEKINYCIKRFTFIGDKPGEHQLAFSSDYIKSEDNKVYIPIRMIPTVSTIITNTLQYYGIFVGAIGFIVFYYFGDNKNLSWVSIMTGGATVVVLNLIIGARYYFEIKKSKE